MIRPIRPNFPGRAPLAALALTLVCLPAGAAGIPGFVDGAPFIEIAGEDAVTVQVSVGKPLLRVFARGSGELASLIAGLESIHAVMLDVGELPDRASRTRRARELVERTDRQLRARGWERIAFVREGGETVRVLVLPRGDLLAGLVVMITEEEEIVFTNIAGTIDLAKIEAIADHFGVPGLDEIEPLREAGRP